MLQESSVNVYISKYIPIVIGLILIYWLYINSIESLVNQPLNMLPVLQSPSQYTYVFYPMRDSQGNNIRQDVFKKDNIKALKEACDARSECQGFNTDAWLKYLIVPQKQWKVWGKDPKRGLYVKRFIK